MKRLRVKPYYVTPLFLLGLVGVYYEIFKYILVAAIFFCSLCKLLLIRQLVLVARSGEFPCKNESKLRS